MTHARRYGDRESHPIPLWNGVFEHFGRIGDALWEFAWLIDRITVEHDGIGTVLGGQPVRLSVIVASLRGSRKETVRRHLRRLELQGYIRTRRTPYGRVIQVLNSHKFGIWKKHEKRASLPLEKPIHEPEKPTGGSEKPKIVVSKEDAAVTQQKDAAEKPSAAGGCFNPWEALGSDLPMGSPRFQRLFEHYAATRSGNPLSKAMERTIQAANKRNVKVPPPFFDAKRLVERREKEELATPADDIPVLEGEAWAN